MRRILMMLTCACIAAGCGQVRQPTEARLLVFTKTAGFRHDSISEGVKALRSLGIDNGLRVEFTEDSAVFAMPDLNRFRAIVFLNTSGDVLNDSQQSALRSFIEAGGGFAGVHAAADTEHDWDWYGQMLGGARFRSHPEIQQATVLVIDSRHPSTLHLPRNWVRADEWYNFSEVPKEVRVLARVDEASYQGGSMGENHPIAWCREVGRGRVWYTALGHTRESYAEPEFLRHVLGGIDWVVGLKD